MSEKDTKNNKDIKNDEDVKDNQNTGNEAVHEDDVMITTKMSDLEKMLENIEEHADKRTDSKFEHFFLPSLIVFGLLALGGFWIIYSITQDMTRLAGAMDPKMGNNMTAIVNSVDSLSKNINQMNQSVGSIDNNLSIISNNMQVVSTKLNRLDNISDDMSHMHQNMDTLQPMLVNMQKINNNMVGIQKSMLWMQRDLSILRSSFGKPMQIFDAVPFL